MTLPGVLTATAGLISAVTGLVVAVQHIWPTQSATPFRPAATATSPAASSTRSTGGSSGSGTRASGAAQATSIRVVFPAGRHVELSNGLRYDILTAKARVASPGQRVLVLKIRITNPGRYDANFWNATFRLKTGSDTTAPTNFLDDLVPGGTTDIGEIDFALSPAARKTTLLVGDDPPTAIALPLTLSST